MKKNKLLFIFYITFLCIIVLSFTKSTQAQTVEQNESDLPQKLQESITRKPITPPVTDTVIKGLEKPIRFYPSVFYNFKVIGAGTDNKTPIQGDTRWIPLYWSTEKNPYDSQKHGTWKIGSANGINCTASYDLYIFCRQEIYNGLQWKSTSVIESTIYKFRSEKYVYVSNLSFSKIPQKIYTGNLQTPSVTVKYNGKTLKKNTDYNVTYKNNKYPGKAQCIIQGKGVFTGTKTIYFYISPSKQSITYLKSNKTKTATIKFKKNVGQSGVQICYSTNSKFKNQKYVNTTSTVKTINNLSRKKIYYFRTRSYKTVSGKKIYGTYSAIKKVTIR